MLHSHYLRLSHARPSSCPAFTNLAHSHDLHREGILVIVRVVVRVMGDELLIGPEPDRHAALKEVYELEGVRTCRKEEVNACAGDAWFIFIIYAMI